MMFCKKSELDVSRSGSSNANYNVDFGASTTLPPSPPRSSYNNLLDGIHGISMMANDLWYDPVRKLLGRLLAFGSKKKAADPSGTPARIHLTHQYMDRLLGRAVGCLQSEASTWWNEYWDALRAIDYNTPDWSLARSTAMHSAITNSHARHPRHTAPPKPKRPISIPEDLRHFIRRENGVEPCLQHLSGAGCPNGRKKCTKRALNVWADMISRRTAISRWVLP
ncbi:TPA: hypothetical protein N0F65_009489 [Lagenidium giganteum]|uniref:Uncharacterized protein n=1 Tax=Lagenidium giganteum TaxID=4803 RepID=A0AAV2ZE70_9STRA|nr:TPA: hypothetical protein N0F65_009489 [Lagenidium giganteum]